MNIKKFVIIVAAVLLVAGAICFYNSISDTELLEALVIIAAIVGFVCLIVAITNSGGGSDHDNDQSTSESDQKGPSDNFRDTYGEDPNSRIDHD